MPNGAHSASRPKTPSLSQFEGQMLKCAERVSTRLTERLDSSRSMESALLQETLSRGLTAAASALERVAEALECQLEILNNLEQLLKPRPKPREKPSVARGNGDGPG